jgi:hypothetical protein
MGLSLAGGDGEGGIAVVGDAVRQVHRSLAHGGVSLAILAIPALDIRTAPQMAGDWIAWLRLPSWNGVYRNHFHKKPPALEVPRRTGTAEWRRRLRPRHGQSNSRCDPSRTAPAAAPLSLPVHSTCSALWTVRTGDTLTTLAFWRLASPFYTSTLPGALVAMALRLKTSFWTTTHGCRSAGAANRSQVRDQPVHVSLPDLAHQRSFAVGRTLTLIPFSRRFSAGSTSIA